MHASGVFTLAIAATFAAVPSSERGEFHVYVYSRTFNACRGDFAGLARELSGFGFTDVYLSFDTERAAGGYAATVRRCNAALHARGIRSHALILQGVGAYFREGEAPDAISAVLSFNSAAPPAEKFDGVTFDLEPHTVRGPEARYTRLPVWDPKIGYGKEGPNDDLVRRTLDILGKAHAQLAESGLITSETMGHFFHDRAGRGDLPSAEVNAFLGVVDFAILMDFADQPRLCVQFARKELESAKRPRSVLVCLKTASNPMPGRGGRGPETTFHEEGWGALQDAMREIEAACGRYPSYRGIGIFEFESFRAMARAAQQKKRGEGVDAAVRPPIAVRADAPAARR